MAELHQSFEASQFQNQTGPEHKDEDEEEEEDEDEDKSRTEFQFGAFRSSEESRFETLAVPSSSSCSSMLEFTETDHYRFEVGSELQTIDGAQFQEEIGISHNEVLASPSFQPAQAQTQNVQQLSSYPASLSELSPTSVTQSISAAPSPILVEQRLSPQKVQSCTPEEDKQNSSVILNSIVPGPIVKISASDGYNWRKYGQKQVKTPPGSRSYYRCTSSECCAKKIECSDNSGRITQTVYRSQHTHDPPRRGYCTREIRLASSAECVANSVTQYPSVRHNNSELSTTSKEPIQENPIPERKRPNSSDSDGNGDAQITKEPGPESKRRLKKNNTKCSDSIIKPCKKPKFVVHAVGDVGISSDGYRWRKYGQKMVKGNPHPRNYYRCTSAGCPVRKHIETVVDNASAVTITYKGIHDHDMPVPKKRHGPPCAPLVAAAAPASMNNSQIMKSDTETHQNRTCSTQWSVDKGGELTSETLELGQEKALESARTLLSIGFEIKPC